MEEKRTLELRHVADLLTMHFNIPSYQRGYRWESKHVEALLDDLYGFSKQMEDMPNKQGKFYCFQPLAIVKNKKLSNETDTVYDVIDGQQRLTTLYLLLSYLEDTRKCNFSGRLATSLFSLKYESRDSDFFDNKEFKSSDIKESIRNIDFFYMTRAYKAIESWFEQKEISKNTILKVLTPDNYKIISGLEGDALLNTKIENDKKNDVRFIWYEVAAKDNTDSIEVFSQLNYGKTALTATDLVKALLLQCDIYTNNRAFMSELAFRRSYEWDVMEKQLQDPFMWSMFMRSDNSFTSHIMVVLSLICNDLYQEMLNKDPKIKIQKESKDFIYDVCNHYLGTNQDGNYAKNVEYVWKKIQTTYTALYNWYKNPNTYHLIGLLVWLMEYKNRDFSNEKRFALLKSLFEQYEVKTKEEFMNYLKKRIAEQIHVEEHIKTKEGIVPWGLKYINYNDNVEQIIKILVTFNVEDIRNQQKESARFPFYLLRDGNITSLEHIHPQNLILDNIKLDTIQAWLTVKESSLRQLKKYEQYENDITVLKLYIKNEESYKENIDAAHGIINKIDKEFDDLANMSEGQMHTLYNLSLVDKDTNSALSNNLLDVKREILKERQKSKNIYVLPTTYKVFGKYYSAATESNILPKLWTKPDREAYFAAIESVYNDFNSHYTKK